MHVLEAKPCGLLPLQRFGKLGGKSQVYAEIS